MHSVPSAPPRPGAPLALIPVLLALVALLAAAPNAFAWRDQNQNRIDDAIERVHSDGWNAAFENQNPSQRMIIGVENPLGVIYAVYVRYDHKPNAADQSNLLSTGVTMAWPFDHIDYIQSKATWAQIQLILARPGVTRVEAVPVDYVMNHYGSRVVRARDSRGIAASEDYALFPSARQELGLDGTGVVIAILDTGINDAPDQVLPTYPGHESLLGKFLGGGEFWCGQPECATAANASMNPQDHGAEASHYHATHCAGTALGTGGQDGYFTGVAPGARLVDCKVLSDAGASVGGANRGLDWVISNKNTLWTGLLPGSIWQGIDVVSMSLGSLTDCAGGSGTQDGAGSELVNTAVDAGLVVVIATGNDNSIECIASPSAADKCISVGASEHGRTLDRSDDKVTGFSNEGPRDDDGDADHFDEMKPSVVAPGAGIISADGDPTSDGGAYQQLSGTSMSTPAVAGCVAILLQANPSLTPDQVKTILQNTAEHNIPSAKASGDRGQDPFGLDINYDPSCGWGLVDMYAASLEAINSTSGVQVVQERAVGLPSQSRIDFKWVTQREYPFLGFNVYRAPDVNGAPGAFAKLNTLIIPPAGDPIIFNDDNRQPYVWADTDPTLAIGSAYWYRVEWIDLLTASHLEAPCRVAYGTLARVATVYYQIVHNAVDNDLLVRIGSDIDYNPGSLGDATFEVLGPGQNAQDSSQVILSTGTPADTGPATLGTLEHWWSVGFKQGDGAEPYLPPSNGKPWFLYVKDAGYVNRTGRVTAFSMFVNSSPGSSSGSTYVTGHTPMPQPTGEGGLTPAILWIPEIQPTGVAVATFRADADPAGCRLTLVVSGDAGGVRASVFRSESDDFATRAELTPEPIMMSDTRFEYVDTTVQPGRTYHYWVLLHEPDGTSFWNGPVAASSGGVATVTFAAPAYPNPVLRDTRFDFTIGSDVASGGPAAVSLTLHDSQGRRVRTLVNGLVGTGRHQAAWDATDDGGRRVGAGVYYYRFRAGQIEQQG
ncbi:MAG TPA: S8 family serine peptidase, partial [Candidatus Eisenbacteria bacterium]|nr:S8 family serine peptidase [Candidatus Eisenbacteria bacterium]